MSVLQRPQSGTSSSAPERDAARGAGGVANEVLLHLAVRELLGALLDQPLPAFGIMVRPHPVAAAALDHAVRAICREAHRLDLPAEQLVIGVKTAWARLAAERRERLSEQDGDVLRSIVSSSIDVFFDARAAAEHRATQ